MSITLGSPLLAIIVFTAIFCKAGCLQPNSYGVPRSEARETDVNQIENNIPTAQTPTPPLKYGSSGESKPTVTSEQEGENVEDRASTHTLRSARDQVENHSIDDPNSLLSDAVSVKVLVGEEDSIAVVDLTTKKRQPNFMEVDGINYYSVDFHWNKSLVFFTANNSIYRAGFLSKFSVWNLKPIVRLRVEGHVRLAVDWVHDRLYWMCDTYQTIEMADIDGGNRRLLVDNIKPFKIPNNIVVDPYEGLLFFVSDFALFKAKLDGSSLRRIAVEQNKRGAAGWGIKNIAIDREAQKILITGKTHESEVANATVFVVHVNYDGTTNQTNLLTNPTNWTDVFSMDVLGKDLYFGHNNGVNTSELYIAELHGNGTVPVLKYVPRYKGKEMWSIRVFHPSVQSGV